MNELPERLRARDTEAAAWFLGSRIGPVHRYCSLVCKPELVVEAIEVSFADFYELVERDGIDGSRLDSALMRLTRTAAGERARTAEGEAVAETDGSLRCELTPLILAGSPKALAGLEELRSMRDHVLGCRRCQAIETRFVVAEAGSTTSRSAAVPIEVLDAVLARLSLEEESAEEKHGEGEPSSAAVDELGAEESQFTPEEGSGEEHFPDGDHEPDEKVAPEEDPPPYFDTEHLGGIDGRGTAEPPRQTPIPGWAPEEALLSRKQVVVASVVAGAAAVAVMIALAGGPSGDDRSGSETRAPATSQSAAQPRRPAPRANPTRAVPVSLAGAKVIDFDPNGGNGERPGDVRKAIDGNEATVWQTELYPAGTFGQGVGIYVALPRPRLVREVRIRTQTPGWDAEIYGASGRPPAELPDPGWKKIGFRSRMRALEAIPVRVADPIRFCLIWVKKLPPGGGLASVAEISFLQDGSSGP